MKILVTGGAGFIGSHTSDAYIKEGHEVVIVDNLSSGKLENINPKAKFYLKDIRSEKLGKVFELEKPEVVVHFAAQKSIPKSVEKPLLDADINIMGLLNVLELCVKHGVKKFVFISSGGALAGDAPTIPTDETYLPNMISPYAINKYTSEKYLHFYREIHGLEYTVLRYANIYGPRQVPDGECGVIPIFMENTLAGKPSKLFTYDDMPRGVTRDYVYIEDVCRANVLALTKGGGEVINIGTGVELYIADIYDTMQEVLGSNLPLVRKKERVGDVRHSALDCAKAKALLDWSPEISLKEGLRRTKESYKA